VNEVTTQTVALLVDALEARGIRPDRLWADLPLSPAELQPGRRIAWSTWVRMMARVEDTCGADQVERLFVPGAGVRTGHRFVHLANAFLSVRDLFALFARWGLRRNLMVITARFAAHGPRHADFIVTIDPDREGSLPTLRFITGILHSLPTLQHLPPATVRLAPGATPHHARYRLELPGEPSRFARARRVLRMAGGASATLDELEQQATELAAKNHALEQQLDETARAGAALAAHDEWLRLALDAGRIGIWRWSPTERRIRLSDELGRMVGLPGQTDLDTGQLVERFHPDDRARVPAVRDRALHHGEAFEIECRVVRPSGELGWLQIKGRPIARTGPDQVDLVGTIADISDHKLLDSRLRFADRLIAAGTLAAGVAHEINNPLGYVLGNLELIRQQLATMPAVAPTVQASLAQMTDGLERIRDVVADLRAFARPDEDVVSRVAPRVVCEVAIRIVSSLVRHRAEVTTAFAADTPDVIANQSRLGQVVINLIVNASQALPDLATTANRIEVGTRRLATGEAVIEVRDNGSGIAPEVLPRLFDPFFTTKPAGVGTGLGLAICQRIVGSLHGRIDVESTPGAGSTFTIVLPPAPPEAAAAPPAPPAPAPAPAPPTTATPTTAGPRRVLVIDDEPVLRRLLRTMLETEGYQVVDADGGRAGLAHVTDEATFHAVLCDLMMPDVDGVAVHAELTRRRPELTARLVFMSGGAVSERTRAFADRPDIVLLTKPFALDHLLGVLASIAP